MNTTKQITRTIKCWSRFGLFLGKNPREDWVRWPWGWRVKLVGPGIETCAPWPVFTWPNTSHCHAVQHQRGYDPCMPGFHPGNDGMAVTTNSGILDHSSSRNRPLHWRFFYLCIKEFRISFSCAVYVLCLLPASLVGCHIFSLFTCDVGMFWILTTCAAPCLFAASSFAFSVVSGQCR